LRAYKKARRSLSRSEDVGRFLYPHPIRRPGASMKVVGGSASAPMAREVPRIFESVRPGSVRDGFLVYYKVEAENAVINPQELMVRFV